ncbi:MAG: DUF2299 family protein, partial [Nitrosopumilaceae archaeon]
MSSNRMRDNVERWLIHDSLSFEFVKNPENSFHVLVKHAGEAGVPVEIFEPLKQPGLLVVGSKVIMKNNQISRYLGFSPEEKEKFEKKVGDYCYSLQAIHKMIEEDGKQKIGVYVVLDDKVDINQQTL